MYKILIIEDDTVIANILGEKFRDWGYKTSILTDFQGVMDVFIQEHPQLILLDVKLPFHNGFYWCQCIRKISQVPIIFISSSDENMDMVLAMNMGADDYIVKPFDLDVLIAKINAILRRTYSFGEKIDMLKHNDLILLLGESTILYNEEKIELTKNELKIMEVLIKNKGKIISKKELMMVLWNNDEFVNDNTLVTNIMRLRKKLEEHGISDLIITKKGQGYFINDTYK